MKKRKKETGRDFLSIFSASYILNSLRSPVKGWIPSRIPTILWFRKNIISASPHISVITRCSLSLSHETLFRYFWKLASAEYHLYSSKYVPF
jgi:hypothetical protein